MIFRGHYKLEKNSLALVFGIVLVSGIGGFIEIAPLFTIDDTVEEAPDMRVYTPLEQAGRDIYIREGCYACHSQMIRTLRDDVDRYGPYSLAAESQYDHPMLWGSKRTGPDLARIGNKYSDLWHVQHLNNPRDVVPASIMPAYRWLNRNELNTRNMGKHLSALRKVGVPYTDDMIKNAEADAIAQASPEAPGVDGLIDRYGEATTVRAFDQKPSQLTEMDAVVSYLQILGRLTNLAYTVSAENSAVQNVPSDGVK